MATIGTLHRFTRIVGTLGLIAILSTARTAAAQAPDFDSVAWQPLGCAAGDDAGDESPSAVDFVGDATHLAAYYAHDASYLYFRYRVDGDPGSGGNHFVQYAWTALMQVPSGDPFQYQYELSLNGKSDTIEVWANTSAKTISFSPMFNDAAETQLASRPALALPLARHLVATDESSFGGNADYFVDFAVPVADLLAQGVIASLADLDGSLFFPATSTNPNNYNKGYLDCPFEPGATLAIDKSVTPGTVPADATTPIAYTIAVRNDGSFLARGVVIKDPVLPSYLSNPTVTVSADDPGITWSVVSTLPLEVRVSGLPIGKTVTVQIHADATPGCRDSAFTNVATAFATNAPAVSDDATLDVNFAAGGCATCTSDADCDDANACTTDACVAGACTATVVPSCMPCATDANCADDGNACTTEACTAGICTSTPIANCTACGIDADCDDANACTTDACVAGACASTPTPSCTPCATDADCADDGNACTTESCTAGVCLSAPVANCTTCVVDADCNDGDGCTTDACSAGACTHTTVADCSGIEGSCDDGIDNDGDGLTDCADPDCANSPACGKPREICGDCIDNDGDGLVDYEDPDCCDTTMALDVRRLMLKSAPTQADTRRLRLRAAYSAYAPAGFDPMRGAVVQLSDAQGTFFCQTMPAAAWKHPHERIFRFRDKSGTLAGGLKRGRFQMKKSGAIMFRARGRQVAVRATDGHDVKVTVSVGGQCSQSTMQLRATPHAVMFP